MLNLDPTLLLLLVACLFVLAYGALGYMRREGLSVQLAVETAVLTAILVGGSWLIGVQLNPWVFLAVLWLVTRRASIIVDLANTLARRDRNEMALRLYDLALALWPDTAMRYNILSNRGAALLRSGQVDAAISTLEGVLAAGESSHLAIKIESMVRYNLGYAYELKGEDALSVTQYNQAIDVLPGSLYARAAQSALKRRKKQGSAH